MGLSENRDAPHHSAAAIGEDLGRVRFDRPWNQTPDGVCPIQVDRQAPLEIAPRSTAQH